MKLKSVLIFLLILLMLSLVAPTLVLCFQMLFDNVDFEDTWMGKMIAQM